MSTSVSQNAVGRRRLVRQAALASSLLAGLGAPLLIEVPAHAAACPITVGSFGRTLGAAQHALSLTGGCKTVEFTAGTYTFNGSLVIHSSGVTVEAAPGAVIKAAAGSHIGNGLIIIAANNVTLQNIHLDGSGAQAEGVSVHASSAHVNGLTTNGLTSRAVEVTRPGSGAVISNCNVTGFGDRGISTSSTNTTVQGCTVTGGRGIGISSYGGASGISFQGNRVSHTGDKGIEVARTSHFTVSGNQSFQNATLGIHLLRSNNGTVSNNTVYLNLNNGIDAHGDTQVVIENNKSYKNGGPRFPDTLEGDGIIVYCSQHVSVLSNTVWDNGQHQPGKRDGIRISDNGGAGGEMPTRYVTVSNNVIYDDQKSPTQGWGIRLGKTNHGDLDYLTVRGNTGHGNMFSGIYTGGLMPHAVVSIVNNKVLGRH